MIIKTELKCLRLAADVSLMIPLIFVVIIGALFLKRLQPPTVVEMTTINTPGPYHAGQVLNVSFLAWRHEDCKVSMTRVMERDDEEHRQFEIGFSTQLIEADHPPFARRSGYTVQIPPEMIPGDYKLFTILRYSCNGLDTWFPRMKRTESIEINLR